MTEYRTPRPDAQAGPAADAPASPGGPAPGSAPGPAAAVAPRLPKEIGGAPGPEPTRYGDWQHKGRVSDF